MSEQQEVSPRYFMVRVWQSRPPLKKHLTLASAIKEAERLTKLTGKPSTVLQSLARVEPIGGDLIWTDSRPEGQ